MSLVHIDGDFPTGKECKYHCSPTCHPLQVDPNNWQYGCLHKAWPQNREGDFCPIVGCGGNPAKCEIPKRLITNMLSGKKRKVTNARRKIEVLEAEIKELEAMITKESKP